MDKINFTNVYGETPINAENLNLMQDNVEKAILHLNTPKDYLSL